MSRKTTNRTTKRGDNKKDNDCQGDRHQGGGQHVGVTLLPMIILYLEVVSHHVNILHPNFVFYLESSFA